MHSLKNVTIVFVSYFSHNKIYKFLKNISSVIPVIILENSDDKNIKKLKNKHKNIKIYYKKNNGYGSSINYASKIIKTKYFFVVQPDILGINTKSIQIFIKYAEKLKDNFSVIGPHFLNAARKGHFQTDIKFKIKKINNVHGSALFFHNKNFKLLKGFDANIFLYWEETDFTKRSWQKKIPVYQLNLVRVNHEKGSSVETKNQRDKEHIKYLYTWHFIWSKFYFFRKHYGKIFSYLYFLPIFLRCLIKLSYYKFNNKKSEKFKKYYFRFNGLINSIIEKKSFLRIQNIKRHRINY